MILQQTTRNKRKTRIKNTANNLIKKGKSVLTNQILRSGTIVGANIHEANYAHSRADFISKMQIALKECYETEYWLKLVEKTNIIDNATYNNMRTDCGKIRKILISSINTAKLNG